MVRGERVLLQQGNLKKKGNRRWGWYVGVWCILTRLPYVFMQMSAPDQIGYFSKGKR